MVLAANAHPCKHGMVRGSRAGNRGLLKLHTWRECDAKRLDRTGPWQRTEAQTRKRNGAAGLGRQGGAAPRRACLLELAFGLPATAGVTETFAAAPAAGYRDFAGALAAMHALGVATACSGPSGTGGHPL